MRNILKRLGRYRRLGATSFLAGGCFIALALYGWGMTWAQLGSYVLMVLLLLAALILTAVVAGWLLRKFMS